MNIIEDVPQQLNPVNLHEDNLVALPLINLFVEACHVIFLRKLDKNSMPHKRRSSFELLVLQYTLDNTPDNSEAIEGSSRRAKKEKLKSWYTEVQASNRFWLA